MNVRTIKKRWPALVLLASLALLPYRHLSAAITSVTLTPAVATTLSNGLSYYLAGVPYTFRVEAVDPAATLQSQWNQIILEFRTGAVTQETCTISMDTDSVVGFPTGLVVDTIDSSLTTDWSNPIYLITIRFLWSAAEYRVIATNDVRATVSSDISASMTDTRAFGYGVIASITLVNFAHTGVAADRRINPYHDAFNVTGSVVYRANPLELQTTIADRVNVIDPGELVSVGTIRIDGVNQAAITPIAFGGTDDFAFTVPALHFTAFALGNRVWSVIATMATPGPAVTETSIDPLVTAPVTINVDRVQVTLIEIINGVGVAGPPIYRSVNFPGTQVRLTARMENGGGNVIGNTTITVRNTTGPGPWQEFDVLILSGQATGVVNVPNPTTPAAVALNATELRSYDIQAISGGAYGGDTFPNGQSDPSRMAVIAPVDIYWDNLDPPGNGPPFTAWVGSSTTAYSMTLNWTPLTNPPDGDFDTYRVYYQTAGPPVGPWLMLDRTSGGAYTTLANYLTGTITIEGLNPLTAYNFYITAVDVFGNVVTEPNATPLPALRKVTTQPKTIECTITDGVLTYNDAHFQANRAGSTRPLRKTAIKVTFFIVTVGGPVGGQPDSANILLVKGDYNSYAVPPLPAGQEFILGGVINSIYTINTHYYRFPCMKTAPNTWVAYIPETNPFMQIGNTLSFLLEMTRSGGTTYSDSTKSETIPGNPNNEMWAFNISPNVATTFVPWPTRVLNNVITKKNPVAYPSFYLSENAHVTIRIYDIKGRPVVTLLDNSLRMGGQNIAEGWAGVNRYNSKVGAGLYYIHIQAKSAVSGKIILNSFKKVVVAR